MPADHPQGRPTGEVDLTGILKAEGGKTVAEVFPELAVTGADGRIETVAYHKLPALLLNELQRQHRDMQHRQQAMERQQRELGELRALVEQRREPTQPAALISGSTTVARDSKSAGPAHGSR